MNLRVLLASLVLTLSLPASGQSLNAEAVASLDAWLNQAVTTTRVPGLVALVTSKDGVIYEHAAGLMNSAAGKPMQVDAIFRLASMTKAVTSTAIMMLVEEGRISLDAPATQYLPAQGYPQVLGPYQTGDAGFTSEPAQHPYTVRQLLTHTSGLGYTFTSDFLNTHMASTPNGRATELPLLFEPGSRWHYGEGTRVLGEIVAAVSGQELFAFLQSRLLEPLGMSDTSYDIPAAKNSRVVTTHRSNGTALIEDPNPPGEISSPHNGDGGLSGTARDYSAFIRLILNHGLTDQQQRLLQADTVVTMGQNHTAPVVVGQMQTTNRLLSENFPLGAGTDSYSLGFQRTEAQVPGMRHIGSLAWAGIFNTEFWIDPDTGIGAVLMMQYLPFYDVDAISVLQGFEQRVYAGLGE